MRKYNIDKLKTTRINNNFILSRFKIIQILIKSMLIIFWEKLFFYLNFNQKKIIILDFINIINNKKKSHCNLDLMVIRQINAKIRYIIIQAIKTTIDYHNPNVKSKTSIGFGIF